MNECTFPLVLTSVQNIDSAVNVVIGVLSFIIAIIIGSLLKKVVLFQYRLILAFAVFALGFKSMIWCDQDLHLVSSLSTAGLLIVLTYLLCRDYAKTRKKS